MAYATVDMVRVAVGGARNLVELADIEDTAAAFAGAPLEQLEDPNVAAVIADAIKEADGFINAYLKQRSSVPLATVPDEIAAMSASWAARILRRQRYKEQPLDADTDAEKIDREFLKAVAEGRIQLGIEPTPAASDIVIDKAAPRDSTRALSLGRMKTFI